MKNTIFITLFLCSLTIFGQEENKTSQDDDIIRSMMRLSTQQLYDTASYYYKNNSFDTAVICYNLLVNAIPQNADIEQQKILLNSYRRLGVMYSSLSDYRMAYNYFVKHLLICEKYNFIKEKSLVYVDLGVIYYHINQYDMAEQYFYKTLELSSDSAIIGLVLSNLAGVRLNSGITDIVPYYLNRSISISKQYEGKYLKSMYNNLGTYYQQEKLYDSAFYYFRLSYELAKKENDIIVEVGNLSDIGKLYFELNKIDSAIFYIDSSNKKALENNFLTVLAENYLTLSKIEKSKRKYENALNHYITYTNLRDSINNASVYGSINLIQRQYEVSKTNQQIEELEIDRQIKENTIRYQRIIMNIVFIVSLLMGSVLIIIIIQNKRLRKAYNVLVDKNVEIIELQKKTPEIIPEIVYDSSSEVISETIPEVIETAPEIIETNTEESIETISENFEEKIPTSCPLSDKEQNELLKRILVVMENTPEICNQDFTINKLAGILHSNQKYISFVINRVLNMNFRAFLNKYRIKEAQRLFSELDPKKYTAASVGISIGFKSRSSFSITFKEITGVSPNVYFKVAQKQQEEGSL